MKISNLYKSKDLRKKMFVLLVCLGLFKLGMHVHVPFINRQVLEDFGQGEGMLSLMNSFTGGALSSFSIFAVGIMPYITASIVIQLLQMDIVPRFTEWKGQGEYGQRKLKQATYVLTVIFAVIQSIGISFSFNQMYVGLIENPSFLTYIIIASVLTLGTVILVVMGEVIEKKGIGKGISIIILAGILITLPDTVAMYYTSEFTGAIDSMFILIIKTILIALFVYFLLLSIIVVNGGERKVPIQSSNQGQFGSASKGTNYLPIKINSAGVIPVIFASALFTLPVTISQFFEESKISTFIQSYISFDSVLGIVSYGVLIMLFTYFYAFIQIDPEKMADNLHKNNQFIPSIRPGAKTNEYFTRLLTRLTIVGALFLSLIAVLPMLMGQVVVLPEQLMMIGTSLIIVVSVVVDMQMELKTELTKSHYASFKGSKRSVLWGTK